MSERASPADQAWTATEVVDAVRRSARSKRTLPLPEGTGRQSAFDAPGGSAEAVVLSIIAGTLGCEAIEPDLTFGAIGGDSLAATQILARVWQALDVRLPLSSLPPDTEMGAFVALVEEKARGHDAEARGTRVLLRRERGSRFEQLTPGQIAILLTAELSGAEGAAAATIPLALRLRGALDPAALRDSLDALIHRHQALSLAIVEEPGGLVQRHRSVGLAELPVIDAGAKYTDLAHNHARMRIDPAEAPLLRPLLLRIGPADHLLVLAIHHIGCDAWSAKVLLKELAVLYEAAITGAQLPLRDDAAGFLDFARWQRELLAREQERLISFWHSALDSLPPDRWLPTDLERPRYRTGGGAAEHFSVDRPLLAELRAFSGEQGVTPFMTLLAGYAVVLAGFSNATDLVIGSPMANRSHPLLADTVGYLSNTVPIRIDLGDDPTVRELLGRVRRASLDAYDHQDLPLPNLIAALAPKRDVAVPPIFQVCLVFNEMQPAPMRGLDVEEVTLHNGASPYDLTLYLEQRADSLAGYVEYPTDLFHADTARELRRRLVRVLTGMVASPDGRAMRLPSERL